MHVGAQVEEREGWVKHFVGLEFCGVKNFVHLFVGQRHW